MGVFLKTSKCGHLITYWIGKPVTGCYNIYVDSMGYLSNIYVDSTNVNSLIFEYTTVVKIRENETALNCGFGFAIANPINEAI